MQPSSVDPIVLIPESKILARIEELGHQISEDYDGQEITMVCVLKQGFVFFSDLIRNISSPLTCEFLSVHPYAHHKGSGEVKIVLDINEPLEGKQVILVDVLIDQKIGAFHYLLNSLKARNPASLKSCVLLHRTLNQGQHAHGSFESPKVMPPDYVGFQVNAPVIAGYGMDHLGEHRELPFVANLGSH